MGIPAKLEVLAIVPFEYPAAAVGRGKKNRKPRAVQATRRLIWCRSSTPRPPPRWMPFSAPDAFGYSIGYSRREPPRPSRPGFRIFLDVTRSFEWCGKRDSNPHGSPQRFLRPSRQPFRHFRRVDRESRS